MKKLAISTAIFCCLTFTQSGQSQNSIDHWETVVFAEDDWKYFVGTAEPDSNWSYLNFNDSLWSLGQGGFGYGDGDDNTTLIPAQSVFIRKEFSLFDTSIIQSVILNADYDDAFVAYINGVEIARANIGAVGVPPPFYEPANQPREAEMYQGGEPEYFTILPLMLNQILVEGVNILSLQVHNVDIFSSDLSAIAYLNLGITDSTFQYDPTPPWFSPPISFSSSNLPILMIQTFGQEIPDEPRITSHLGIVDNGWGNRNYVSDPFNGFDGQISIELRGSTSQGFPKQPYAFETQDTANQNLNVSLLGMPKENDWILHNPFSDKSLIRNVIAYRAAATLMDYAPRTRFCELLINDEYLGLYILTEKIKRDKNRVDIAKLNPSDTTGDELTGGYIFKIDKFTGTGGGGWESPFPSDPFSSWYYFYQFHHPKTGVIQPQQARYIQEFMDEFETVMWSTDYNDPLTGYSKYIDDTSFIDYFLINEISRNVDGYRLSTFLYKDKDSRNGKLKMGPVWDFNLGFANADYCDAWEIEGWSVESVFNCNSESPFWWYKLLADTMFQNKLRCRWEATREQFLHTDTLLNYIDLLTDTLEEAQQRNFRKWPVLGEYVWPNYFIGESYLEEIQFLKSWLEARLAWMDENIPGPCREVNTGHSSVLYAHEVQIAPNPFCEIISISFESIFSKEVKIEIFDVAGKNRSNEVKFSRTKNSNQNKVELITDVLPDGIYFLKIGGKTNPFVMRKIVKASRFSF